MAFAVWLPQSCMSRGIRTRISNCNWRTQNAIVFRQATTTLSTCKRAPGIMQDWASFLEHTQRGGKVLPFRKLDVA